MAALVAVGCELPAVLPFQFPSGSVASSCYYQSMILFC
jgi:hypothetical protein